MSVIQKIQDKYGKVMAIIIGISLVIFIVMLAFENGGRLFAGNTTTVGKVNGESVEIKEFSSLVEQQSAMMEQRGMGGGEALSSQANEQAWGQKISQILLTQESKKLGLDVGAKELNYMLFASKNPPQELAQAFTDPQTGHYDAHAAQQQIIQIKTKGTAEQKAQIDAFLDQMVFPQLAEKLNALVSNSINYPKWLIEKQSAQNNRMAKVSFVREPYTSISDSAVKISDDEIKAYISKHKKDFKQEESRSIAYVAFNASPSSTDSTEARNAILQLKPAFDSTHDVKAFLLNNGVNSYYDGYISSKRIQVPMKDSILRVGTGNIYGPYIDANTYALAKVVSARSIPDTVKIRHILIATVQQDPQTGQAIPIRDSATARKLADSLALAVRNGSNFDTLVAKFSNDPGSASNGGVYENVPSGQMAPEFNDFIFGNPVGSKGVVKTQFGYHYIEILSQKGSDTGYKIAYLTKPITASAETDMTASNQATQFAAQARNQKTFDTEAEKLSKSKGINKAIATDIAPMGGMIQGIGYSRSLVKAIYKAGVGDMLQPERVGDYYVVALVTEANKEGTMSANKARMYVEPLLRNQKKAEMIAKKIGKITTLEAAAAALKHPIEVADSIRFDGQANPMLGFEPKVVGASFNKTYVGKVIPEPIPGTQGVYVVKIDNIAATPSMPVNVEEERQTRFQQARQRASFQFLQTLRNAATIKDYRTTFY
ncbi:MAG: SurA N-terminal domain-containing protein [Niabella sp.]